jgi:hypothetical protein
MTAQCAQDSDPKRKVERMPIALAPVSLGPVSRRAWFWTGVAAYLAVVAVTAVITGPTVLRGADGLEIGPLLLLGLPSSLVLMFVGGWGMLPFGDTASAWGALVGLIAGRVVNVLIAWRSMTRYSRAPRPVPGG